MVAMNEVDTVANLGIGYRDDLFYGLEYLLRRKKGGLKNKKLIKLS